VRPAGVRGRRRALCFNCLVRADAVSRSARPVRGSKSAGFARERRAEPRKDACLPFSPRGSNSTVMKGQRSAPTSLLLFYDASFASSFFLKGTTHHLLPERGVSHATRDCHAKLSRDHRKSVSTIKSQLKGACVEDGIGDPIPASRNFKNSEINFDNFQPFRV
jgi:hypothetical protein